MIAIAYVTHVAILGARGYAGRELLRLLVHHPHITAIRPLSGSTAGDPVGKHIPTMRHTELTFGGPEEITDADVVFMATPDETAMAAAADLKDSQTVIDLSRAHRQRGLGGEQGWVYGWADVAPVPSGTKRIANPGCYPTAAMLTLAPIMDNKLHGTGPVIVDGKSGVSGAGATPRADLHFPEANEAVRAYKVDQHDHGDEIQTAVRHLSGDATRCVRFTPHLIPQTRGLLTTCYIPAADGLDQRTLTDAATRFYADQPFVHVVDEPNTAHVRGSNHAHLALHLDTEANLIVGRCAIDNLVKGAAGTAVQNLNDAMGWKPTAGLEAIGA